MRQFPPGDIRNVEAVTARMRALHAARSKGANSMRTFGSVFVWLLVLISLQFIAHWIPAQERAFRTAVALTWFLWVVVGLLYSVRFLWRFMRG